LVAAVLIGVNWLTYVWAVNAGFIVETSLGYFINPLLSVLMGVVFLRERLRPWQWAPLGLATAGVLYLTLAYGSPPWIALTLAFSFGFYGLAKKTAPLGSLYGLALETGFLFLPALAFLGYAEAAGQGAFLHSGPLPDLLMIGAGVVTTMPLLLFASAAQRIPLSLVGVLQYIAPTIQFLLGVVVYHEPFTPSQMIGFGLVWIALALFAGEGLLAQRRQPASAGAPSS
jgi:chloramphenicol-sensitive protein RarD